ncbi:MAG: hypothetical protein K2W95_20520 [Candidatus Obscuribacterales bacterium]|nr:hypothetical protein [Candidatus Obscuribacterales bacterium]
MSLSESLEAPVHSAEKESVLKVLRSTGTPVRPADVSKQTGLPVLQVTYWLNKIASETGGHLIVDTAGGVAYKFQSGFESAYLLKGTGTLMQRAGRILLNATMLGIRFFCLAMFFLIRVSFGIALVLSVVVIIALVVLVVIRLLAGDGDSDDGGGIDFSGIFSANWMRYWAFDWLWDWFYWSRYISWDPYHQSDYEQRSGKTTVADSQPAAKKSNFLDNCFEFLFGYGDPNADLEEKRWTMIARAIQANRGVVIAEQLAPYAAEITPNEDWMLPILVRFNGSPDVSESGTIIYSFPEFQKGSAAVLERSADGLSVAQSDAREQALQNIYSRFLSRQSDQVAAARSSVNLPAFLQEQEWKFCDLSSGSITAIAGFAGFALIGSVALMIAAAGLPFLVGFIPVLAAIFVYGLLFAIVPSIRWIVEKRINEGIQKRNQARLIQSRRLQDDANREETLSARLTEAAVERAAGAERPVTVAYSTEQDLLDQEFDTNDAPVRADPQASNPLPREGFAASEPRLISHEEDVGETIHIVDSVPVVPPAQPSTLPLKSRKFRIDDD